MPTYEYRCEFCGKNFDVFQGIRSKPRAKCPMCGNVSTKRLIGSGGGIIFKGSGWPGQEISRGENINNNEKGNENDAEERNRS